MAHPATISRHVFVPVRVLRLRIARGVYDCRRECACALRLLPVIKSLVPKDWITYGRSFSEHNHCVDGTHPYVTMLSAPSPFRFVPTLQETAGRHYHTLHGILHLRPLPGAKTYPLTSLHSTRAYPHSPRP